MHIRPATTGDAESIRDIYNYYIENTTITFEENPVSSDYVCKQIKGTAKSYPWLVGESGDRVVGYAYASGWQSRCAYRHSAETSLYLAHDETGRGIGKILYRSLIDELKQKGLHSLLAAISLPNPASIALHRKLGFEQVGHFKEVGRKFDKWIDVAYWELILESSS